MHHRDRSYKTQPFKRSSEGQLVPSLYVFNYKLLELEVSDVRNNTKPYIKLVIPWDHGTTCQGPAPRVPRTVDYDPINLDMAPFCPSLQWQTAGNQVLRMRTNPGRDLYQSLFALAQCTPKTPGASDPGPVTRKPTSSAGMVVKCQTKQGITTGSHVCLTTSTRELEIVPSPPYIATPLRREHA
jgi:hypothetical protein